MKLGTKWVRERSRRSVTVRTIVPRPPKSYPVTLKMKELPARTIRIDALRETRKACVRRWIDGQDAGGQKWLADIALEEARGDSDVIVGKFIRDLRAEAEYALGLREVTR
jgi:hypothetical protein